MAYLSLYRKYRSQSFEELAGQEHVTRTLQNAIRSGRVGHAYLFSGPRGTGKTSTARLLARALNCERGPSPSPCGECVACREIRDGVSPSVVEIDAASSRGIDEVRDLRQRVMTVPSQPGARKVFIVDEVHMLTTEACNALLKTLEEPPSHVLFILATTDAQKLPATILSRCQRFEFRRGSVGLIGERLKYVSEAEGYSLEPEAARLIARAAGGSWRDAISLLEQALSYGETTVTAGNVAAVLGAVEEESLLALADALADADGRTLYPLVGNLIDAGTEPRQLARDLGEHLRALLMADAGALPAGAYSPETARRLEQQAARFGTKRLVAALEALSHAEKEMRWSDSGRVVLEVALARLMLSPSSVVTPEVRPSIGVPSVRASERVAESLAPTAARPLEPARPARNESPPSSTAAAGTQSGEPITEPDGEFDPFEHEELPPPLARDNAAESMARPAGGSDAAAGPTVSSEAPALTLDQLKRRWQVVIEELKRAKPATTAALLGEAQPVACDGQTLVIGFRQSILKDKWDRGDHKQRLHAALQSVFGATLPVRATVLGDPPAAGTSGEARANGTAVGPDAARPAPADRPPPARPQAREAAPASGTPGVLQGDALLHEALAMFDGQIVEPDSR